MAKEEKADEKKQNDDVSLTAYAGAGGVAACCLVLELLGGATILTGIASAIGLSTGLTYVGVVGFAGLIATGVAYLYKKKIKG